MSNKNYYINEKIGVSGIADTRNPIYVSQDYEPFKISPRKINVGDIVVPKSRYDETLGNLDEVIYGDVTVDDLRARQQSGLSMFGNALANNIVIAGTTAVSGTLGLANGIFSALNEGKIERLWDNRVNNWATNIQERTREALPIYRGQEYSDKNLIQKMGTGIFWADLVQNLGFAEGMLIQGAGMAKLLSSAPSIVRGVVPSLTASIGEASIEAINTRNDEELNKVRIANDEYNKIAQTLQSPFALGVLDSEYNKTLNAIESDANAAGNFVFGSNVALLTMSNAIQFGNLFSRGFGTAKRLKGALKRTGNVYSTDGVGLTIAKEGTKKVADALSEGIEEVSQGVISSVPSNFSDYNTFNESMFNPEKRELVGNIWQALGESYSQALNDSETGVEFATGFLIGALGIPTIRKSRFPIGIENNAGVEIYNAYKEVKRQQELADKINARLKDDKKINSYYNGLVRHLAIQDRMNTALDNEDMFNYKNAESAQLISDIMMFDSAGDIDKLKSIVNESIDMSDEGITNIIKETSVDGRGPFMFNGNPMSTDEVRMLLQEKIDIINNKIDNYIKDKEYMESAYPDMDDDTLNNAMFLKEQFRDHSNRYTDLFDQSYNGVKKLLASIPREERKPDKIKKGEGIYVKDSSGKKKLVKKSSIDYFDENGSPVFKDEVESKIEQPILSRENFAELLVTNSLFSGYLDSIIDNDKSTMSYDERQQLKTTIEDMLKLDKSLTTINKSLRDIITNPSKSSEDIQKVKEDVTNEYNSNGAPAKKTNSASSYGQLEDLLSTGEISLDNIKKGNSEVTKSYDKASLFKKKAVDFIDSNFKDEHKEIAKKAINNRFNNSSNYSDLSNPNILTDFGIEYSILDSKAQEDFQFNFNRMLEIINSKINEGEAVPKNIKSTSPKVGEPVGRDSIPQIPESKNTISIDNLKKEIEASNLLEENKKEVISSIESIKSLSESFKNDRNPNSARKIRSTIDSIKTIYSSQLLSDFITRVEDSIKSDIVNPSSSIDVLNDNTNTEDTQSYPETSVSGVMKTAIPQFDLTAKADGRLIDFYIEGEDRNVSYAYVYNKLKEAEPGKKNAFEYVNEGNIKLGDTLDVVYEEAGENHPEIFWLYHNGNLVNALSAKDSIEGATEIKNRAKESKPATITVTKIMDGKYAYTRNTNRPIKEILGTDTALLGIMKNGRMVANTDMSIEPVFNSTEADGKVYILLPNSKGTLSPKNLQIVHFNKAEFNLNEINDSNPMAKDARSIINSLVSLSDITEDKLESRMNDIYLDMVETFYIPDSFHIDVYTRMDGDSFLKIGYESKSGGRKNTHILIKSNSPTSVASLFGSGINKEAKTINKDDLYNQILDVFSDANLAFNISAKKLIGRNSSDYVKKLVDSNILRTYLTSNRMQGTWFLFNEKPDATHTSSFEAYKAERAARNSVYVPNIYGVNYTVINDVIYTQDGKVATLDSQLERLIKDSANAISNYGNSMYGVNQHNGKVLIEDKYGKRGLNRNTNTYLNDAELQDLENRLTSRKPNSEKSKIAMSQFLQSQKSVRRNEDGSPKTDTGYYEILEDDGNYHQYERVHSVIGSNWSGASTGNAATGFGNMIDELVRKFFIEPSKLRKPDNMSQSAYNNLLSALGKFKANADAAGIKILTDRLVVYHKYPNGKRIAGELDMLSYNEFTGDISIVDTKTSKYSTKSKSFTEPVSNQTRSTAEQYSLQLSAYARLFNDSFDFPISRLTIMPFNIAYKDGNLDTLKAEDYIRLNRRSDVFSESVPMKTYKGQYVTTKSGKVTYHTADVREILNINNLKYYLTKVNSQYKLILPNGRSMSLDDRLVNDSMDEVTIKSNLTNYIYADNVQEVISKVLKDDYLSSSPYGNSILIEDNKTSTPKNNLEAVDILNSLKPNEKVKKSKAEDAIKQRENDSKSTVASIDTSFGREQTSKKSWIQLSQDEKNAVKASFKGVEEAIIQKYWDNVDSIQREKIISCP